MNPLVPQVDVAVQQAQLSSSETRKYINGRPPFLLARLSELPKNPRIGCFPSLRPWPCNSRGMSLRNGGMLAYVRSISSIKRMESDRLEVLRIGTIATTPKIDGGERR